MPDTSLIDYLRRFLTAAEVETAYQAAGAAYISKNTEVTITASSMDGASHSGEFSGDPLLIMQACKFILEENEAMQSGTVQKTPTGAMDFSRRYLST